MSNRRPRNAMQNFVRLAFSIPSFLVGWSVLVLLLTVLVIREWRANHSFVEETCTVLDNRILKQQDDDRTTYRAELFIRYVVDGQVCEAWTYDASNYYADRASQERILEQFVLGRQYPCWCDPDDPTKVVLVRGWSWFLYLALIVPLVFVVGSGIEIIRCFRWAPGQAPTSTSAPVAMPRPPKHVVPAAADRHMPTIDLSHRTGKYLAYRLPRASVPGCVLCVLVAFLALFWNGIISVFVILAFRGFAIGEPDWCLTLFIMPFILIGVLLLLLWARVMLITPLYWSPTVEISDHPLTPGETSRLYVVKRGPLQLSALRVLVVCEEIAKHDVGDDRTVDQKRVFEAAAGRPDEARDCESEIRIPAGAMHSFKTTNNEIQWKVVVHGKALGWLKVFWEFPFIVRPAAHARESQ